MKNNEEKPILEQSESIIKRFTDSEIARSLKNTTKLTELTKQIDEILTQTSFIPSDVLQVPMNVLKEEDQVKIIASYKSLQTIFADLKTNINNCKIQIEELNSLFEFTSSVKRNIGTFYNIELPSGHYLHIHGDKNKPINRFVLDALLYKDVKMIANWASKIAASGEATSLQQEYGDMSRTFTSGAIFEDKTHQDLSDDILIKYLKYDNNGTLSNVYTDVKQLENENGITLQEYIFPQIRLFFCDASSIYADCYSLTQIRAMKRFEKVQTNPLDLKQFMESYLALNNQ